MDVKLPNLGEGADSGTVVNLLVKAGDTITAGQGLLELESEKAVATIPAPAGGVVGQIFVKLGDKVSVGQRLISSPTPLPHPPPPRPRPLPSQPQPRPSRPNPSPTCRPRSPAWNRPRRPPSAASRVSWALTSLKSARASVAVAS